MYEGEYMFRFYIALWMSKLSVIALKLTGHNGTDFPGTVALKICPDFLKYIAKPKHIIGITGTNGKTTVTNLLTDALAADGIRVLSNREGSNIRTGISTILMKGVTLFNRSRFDSAVLEIDERSAGLVFPYVRPELMLINNLTRDSIMRNAHPGFIARILTEEMPKETRLVINGDDLIACSVAPSNDRVYFGIDRMDTDTDRCINLINDMQVCPRCTSKLVFDTVRYHHIGKAHCPECGFSSPNCDYEGHDVNLMDMTMQIRDKDGSEESYRLINESVFNIYNIVAVTAVMREMGYSKERVSELLSNISIVKTRFNEQRIGDYTLSMQLSKDKNALAASRVFDYISSKSGRKEIILMMSCLGDTKHWSENTCWLYDCDFEFLADESFERIIVAGDRGLDYVLRLELAGVDRDRIRCTRNEKDIPKLLKLSPGTDVYFLYGTDSISLAESIASEIRCNMLAKSEVSEC